MNQKNPGAAAVLSFLMPGLGQIYNGQIGIGLAFMLLVWPMAVASIFVGIGLIIAPVVWIVGIWDAYNKAEKYNQEHADTN